MLQWKEDTSLPESVNNEHVDTFSGSDSEEEVDSTLETTMTMVSYEE